MSNCILGYFLKHVEDEETKSIVQFTFDTTSTHIEKLSSIFEKEHIPLPTGFTMDDDVNINAPRLYSDMFMLTFLNHMSKMWLLSYSGFIAMSAREDIRAFFIKGLEETSDLFNRSSEVAISQGFFVRAPYIAYPTKKDYEDSKKYFSGVSFFSKQRPLNTVEISHLYMNIQTNLIGSKLALSFAQISPREELQKWMLRGNDISKKHLQIFSSILLENNIQPPVSSDAGITDSTTPPFSDKVALFLMGVLSAAGVGNYATAAAASQRSDLVINYERLSLEIGQYAKVVLTS
ncbi:DUF3231 family protein [Paenisporosarcina sp. TG20]|uniref:DUF3231 family protein n=1 Tax=Paenisporosarcina sp. TG20 TaxID=1211706 RepID=UPI0003710179